MYAGGARPVMSLGPAGDKGEQARRVFDALRAFDHTAVSAIWAQCPDSGGQTDGPGGRLDLELEDEKVNPKFAQMAVKAYLQRAQFPRDTRVELGGMEIGVYE